MNETGKKFSGWAVFAGCVILMIFPGGVTSYTTGLFMYPICEEFGFSVTAYSVVFTISSIMNAFVSAFLAGYLSKGTRKMMKLIMAVSVVGVCMGFSGQSLCTELWQFYLMAIVRSMGFNLITFVPVAMLISNWFVKKRTLLTGIAMACSNLGGAVGNGVVSQIIARYGWRAAYVSARSVSLVICLFAVVFLIKRSPEEYGEKPYGAEEKGDSAKETAKIWLGLAKKDAMKQPTFYLLCMVMFLTGFYITGVMNHVVTYLCGSGWDIGTAGVVMTFFTLAGILGSFLGGVLLEKIGYAKGVMLGGAMLLLAVMCLILGSKNHVFAYIFAILLGLSGYMGILLPSQAVMNTLGARDYASLYGLTYSFYLVGASVSVPVIAVISEKTGYLTAWTVIAAAIILIVGLHLKCIREGDKLKRQFTEYK